MKSKALAKKPLKRIWVVTMKRDGSFVSLFNREPGPDDFCRRVGVCHVTEYAIVSSRTR